MKKGTKKERTCDRDLMGVEKREKALQVGRRSFSALSIGIK